MRLICSTTLTKLPPAHDHPLDEAINGKVRAGCKANDPEKPENI
jgi:hypothetical protein